jgi:hypothetical protein
VSEVVTNPVVITLATVAVATNLAMEANPGARKTIESTMQVRGAGGNNDNSMSLLYCMVL